MNANDYKMFSGERCRELRASVGLTQRELADHIVTTQGYVAKIEMGVKKPSAELLYRMALVLDRRMEDFFV